MASRASASDVALDIGTSATRMRGLARTAPISRPSVVWRGGDARPALRGGVIVDSAAAAAVVADLLRSVTPKRPAALACVPSDATAAERAALVESVLRAGARTVCVVPEPVAAAAGAGLPIESAVAHVIVDVGEGVTDCAVVMAGELLASAALRVGVADLRAAVRSFARASSGVRTSEVEAERVLREVGLAETRAEFVRIVGTPQTGVGPVIVPLDVVRVRGAIAPLAERIVRHAAQFVAALPRLGVARVAPRICLSGGGALLAGLADDLGRATELAVERAPRPLLAVIEGATRLAAGELRFATI